MYLAMSTRMLIQFQKTVFYYNRDAQLSNSIAKERRDRQAVAVLQYYILFQRLPPLSETRMRRYLASIGTPLYPMRNEIAFAAAISAGRTSFSTRSSGSRSVMSNTLMAAATVPE